MIRSTTFSGRSVAVFGLGASGNATARSLMAGGATVAAWDDNLSGRDAAAKQGIPIVDLSSVEWSQFAALVLAPGVPLTHPEPHWTVKKAQALGIEVIGDIELFARERAKVSPDSPFIAITGTNGKSTTTALIAHMLRATGRDVQLGGNIGRAILTLEPPDDDRFHVIEMSSFQIDLTPTLNPSLGILLNVTPDHIDRHGSVEHYASVKERLVQGASTAIVGVDDAYCREIYARAEARGQDVFAVSVKSLVAHGIMASGRKLIWASGGKGKEVADLSGIASLRGTHNAQNAAAAFAALALLGFSADELQRGLTSFPGLAHRMEEIGRKGRILFINDSKATNADSTEKALATWDKGIHWIIGGKPKDGGIEALKPYFSRIARAYLIGQATEEFAATLGSSVPFERCGTLDVAVAAAARDAAISLAPEPVVLLSPACASYDQYKNFEERGDHFRKIVSAVLGERGVE